MCSEQDPAAAAAVALARHRWGTRRNDSLMDELEGRLATLEPEQRSRLASLAEAALDAREGE